jgi:N-terminal domain of anti-restriction factor ArdC
MATATKSKARRGPNPQTEARKAEIELATERIDQEAPDFRLFLARWGDRYSLSNLMRLWVQCPTATCLHKFETWRGMGRQVRKGERAILIMTPRVSYDAEKITPANPKGEVFHGASWVALFDYAQTSLIGDYDDRASNPDATAEQLAEVKRLRQEATSLHPDVTGDTSQEAARAFSAAWDRYESARDRLKAA